MNAPTKKFTTPVAKVVIEIKDWITGEDSEYIDGALLSKVDVKSDNRGSAKIDKIDIATGLVDETHREIEKFIVSIDGQKEKVVDATKKLPEDDYLLIQKEIAERRKKKVNPVEGYQPA